MTKKKSRVGILDTIFSLIMYMNNKAWFMCHVYYKPEYPNGREYLTLKQCLKKGASNGR